MFFTNYARFYSTGNTCYHTDLIIINCPRSHQGFQLFPDASVEASNLRAHI
jgi:hypothetical protein